MDVWGETLLASFSGGSGSGRGSRQLRGSGSCAAASPAVLAALAALALVGRLVGAGGKTGDHWRSGDEEVLVANVGQDEESAWVRKTRMYQQHSSMRARGEIAGRQTGWDEVMSRTGVAVSARQCLGGLLFRRWGWVGST